LRTLISAARPRPHHATLAVEGAQGDLVAMLRTLTCLFSALVLVGCASSSSGTSSSGTGDASTTATPTVPATSPVDAPPSGYDPCAGKKCGDSCTMCAPDAKDCVETMELKMCGTDGKCTSAMPKCGAAP
jgi:hypothetical protein